MNLEIEKLKIWNLKLKITNERGWDKSASPTFALRPSFPSVKNPAGFLFRAFSCLFVAKNLGCGPSSSGWRKDYGTTDHETTGRCA